MSRKGPFVRVSLGGLVVVSTLAFAYLGTVNATDTVEQNNNTGMTPAIPEDIPPTWEPPVVNDECDYFRGEIVREGFDRRRLESYDHIFQRTGDAVGLGCLDAMIQNAIRNCNSHFATRPDFVLKHHDDCLAWEIGSYMFPDWGSGSGYKYVQKLGVQSNGSVCTRLHNADMRTCPSGSPLGFFKFAGGCKPCAAGSFFFAADPENPNKCKVVQPKPEDEECGTFTLNYWESTPISLVWNEGTEAPATLSKFPLDPRNPELWHIWRASEAFPLLVYDPSHEGRIVSASQLFGPWTFGGKQFASLKGEDLRPTPWKDGFEALAVLDSNGNSRIDGEELKPLALWFDKNQNGEAEEGEVLPVSEAGITDLSYGPSVKDSDGNAVVEFGYTRILAGKEMQGKAIDWVTKSAPSQFDLLTHFYSVSSESPILDGVEAEGMPYAREPKFPDSPDEIGAQPEDYIGGVWEWVTLGEEAQGARGYFIIRDDVEGVAGHSILETPFKRKGSQEMFAYGTMLLLTGKKSKLEDGSLVFDFELSGNNPKVASKATFSRDLKLMKGTTTVTKGNKPLRYQWVAKHR